MDAIIVVDMQVGLLNGPPKHDLQDVVTRINQLTTMIRAQGGAVIWIRHCGQPGDRFEPHTNGWAFLPDLICGPNDHAVEKTLNDPFAGTTLKATLDEIAPDQVFITGWATDFCVDATVRSTVANNHHVVVVRDGHTVNDRDHLNAPSIIQHHNWVWSDLLTHRSIRLATTQEILDQTTHTDSSTLP